MSLLDTEDVPPALAEAATNEVESPKDIKEYFDNVTFELNKELNKINELEELLKIKTNNLEAIYEDNEELWEPTLYEEYEARDTPDYAEALHAYTQA